MSERTKKLKTRLAILNFLSILCVFGPLVWFLVTGWKQTGNSGKFALCSITIMCIVLTLISALAKYKIRSIWFILLIAVISIMKNAMPFLIVFSVLQIIDEMLFEPLLKDTKAKYIANLEIDRRGI